MAKGELSSRTTISMKPELLEKAEERWKRLGYSSFSEYVQFLLESDISERKPHVTFRDEESGAQHSKAKQSYTSIPPKPAVKIAESKAPRKRTK